MVLNITMSVVEGSNEVKDLPTLLLQAAGAWKVFTNTVIVLALSLFRRHIWPLTNKIKMQNIICSPSPHDRKSGNVAASCI